MKRLALMWIDKKRFHELIKDYQDLNEDLDSSWLTARVVRLKGMSDDSFQIYLDNREHFKEYKEEWYKEKRKRFKNETKEEREERLRRLEEVGNELFSIFYELIESVLGGFGFHQLFTDEFYSDLKQEIIDRLLTIVNRFDARKENPLAYFIQVIKNLAYNERGDEFAHRYKFLTSSFLETHEVKEDKNAVQNKTKKKEKEAKNPFEKFMEK